ncbi:hypothetical protein PGTUg99_028042 [Puccinia graminis f. sp. tritici]|uniref:Uncharacterized protein n=1 Tax=Puccinia graminis f. sp. tritici TaxID=56615 RepID=A0A5B0Q3U5_PUCGR|nr:hypothetical protein PGTUg99_028042 [Puccinia graminis f. sp. tritici]
MNHTLVPSTNMTSSFILIITYCSVFQSYEASTKHCGRIGNRTNDHRCSDGQSLVKIGTDYLAWIVYLALFPQQ